MRAPREGEPQRQGWLGNWNWVDALSFFVVMTIMWVTFGGVS